MLKYLLPVILVLSACGESKKNVEEKKEIPVVAVLKNEAEIEARMADIDSLLVKSQLQANSLMFANEEGKSVSVIAHLVEGNLILKMEENFSEGNGGTQGIRYYYLNDGKLIATHEMMAEMSNNVGVWVDRYSFYDKNEKVVKSKERRADEQEKTEVMQYTPCALSQLDTKKVFRILNNQEEFATNFQGFYHAGQDDFIQIGANGIDGYTATLRLSFQDDFIKILNANEKAYIGKPVKVQFDIVRMVDGFTFMEYLSGSF